MTIKKKVERREDHLQQERSKVIEKGGHVGADLEVKKKEWMNFSLRIRLDMLKEIDEAMTKTVGISKTGWILQAIHDKLKRVRNEE